MKNNDPFTRYDQTRFTMRINSELLEKIKAEAEKNKRSTAKQIEFILEQYVATLSAEWTQLSYEILFPACPPSFGAVHKCKITLKNFFKQCSNDIKILIIIVKRGDFFHLWKVSPANKFAPLQKHA